MVEVGIRSILNFAPTILSVPEGVDVRRVDLSSELQILAYHEQRKNADSALATRRRGGRMSVLVVGISHKTAPVSVLEQVALDADGHPEADPRGLRPRARHRGHRALDLQPHRGLRRRRPLPRQRRGDLADARRAAPAGRPRTCSPTSTCTTTTAPSRTCSTSPPASTRWCSARARSSARPARRCGWARRTARSAPRSTCCSSRRCASASARTPRPTSTGSRPAWSPSALDRAAEHLGGLAGKHVVVVGAGSMAGLTVGDRRRAPAPPRSWSPTAPPSAPPASPSSTTRTAIPLAELGRLRPARSTCSSPAPARPASLIDVDAVAARRRDGPAARRRRPRPARATSTPRWPHSPASA